MLRPLAIATQSPTKATKKAVGLKSTLESITSARPVQGPVEAPLAKAAREAKEGPAFLRQAEAVKRKERLKAAEGLAIRDVGRSVGKDKLKFDSIFGEVNVTMAPDIAARYQSGDPATRADILKMYHDQALEEGRKAGKEVVPRWKNTEVAKSYELGRIMSPAMGLPRTPAELITGQQSPTIPTDERFNYEPYTPGSTADVILDQLDKNKRFYSLGMYLRETRPEMFQGTSNVIRGAAERTYETLPVNPMLNFPAQFLESAADVSQPGASLGKTTMGAVGVGGALFPYAKGIGAASTMLKAGSKFGPALEAGLNAAAREGIIGWSYLERNVRARDLANILEGTGAFASKAEKAEFIKQIQKDAKEWASKNSKDANEFLEQEEEFYKNLIRPSLDQASVPPVVGVPPGATRGAVNALGETPFQPAVRMGAKQADEYPSMFDTPLPSATDTRRMGALAGEIVTPEGSRYQQLIPDVVTKDGDLIPSVPDDEDFVAYVTGENVYKNLIADGIDEKTARAQADKAVEFKKTGTYIPAFVEGGVNIGPDGRTVLDTQEEFYAYYMSHNAWKALVQLGVPQEVAGNVAVTLAPIFKRFATSKVPLESIKVRDLVKQLKGVLPEQFLPQMEDIIKKGIESIKEELPNVKKVADDAGESLEDDEKLLLSVAKQIEKLSRDNPLLPKGVPLSKLPDEVIVAAIRDATIREVNTWRNARIGKANLYISFYRDDVLKANAILQQFAESRYGRKLTDNEIDFYHLVSGFASPSNAPYNDSDLGMRIFDRWMMSGQKDYSVLGSNYKTIWDKKYNKSTGNWERADTKFAKLNENGDLIPAKISPAYYSSGMSRVIRLIDNLGFDAAMDFMRTKHSFQEIVDAYKLTDSEAKAIKAHEYLSLEDGGYGVFGIGDAPKLGSYVLNRWQNFETVTKDMWVARTMARLTGQPLVVNNKVIKEPWGLTKSGVRLRGLLDQAWAEAGQALGMEPAMVQEAMWDIEQVIYNAFGNPRTASYVSEGLQRGIDVVTGVTKVPSNKEALLKGISEAPAARAFIEARPGTAGWEGGKPPAAQKAGPEFQEKLVQTLYDNLFGANKGFNSFLDKLVTAGPDGVRTRLKPRIAYGYFEGKWSPTIEIPFRNAEDGRVASSVLGKLFGNQDAVPISALSPYKKGKPALIVKAGTIDPQAMKNAMPSTVKGKLTERERIADILKSAYKEVNGEKKAVSLGATYTSEGDLILINIEGADNFDDIALRIAGGDSDKVRSFMSEVGEYFDKRPRLKYNPETGKGFSTGTFDEVLKDFEAKGGLTTPKGKPGSKKKFYEQVVEPIRKSYTDVQKQFGLDPTKIDERILKEADKITKYLRLEQNIEGVVRAFYELKSKTVTLLKGKANVDSLIHEVGHHLKEVLLSEKENGPIILRLYGDTNDIEGHERFANHLVAYFREGRMPNKGLAGAFASVKRWLQRTAKTYAWDEIDPEFKTILDEIYNSETQATKRLLEDLDSLGKTANDTTTTTKATGAISGGIRRDAGVLPADIRTGAQAAETAREADGSLKGLPRKVGGFTYAHHAPAEEVARRYMEKTGREYVRPNTFQKVDEDRARRIAQAYEDMKHDPTNPVVKASYDALAKETMDQYDELVKEGITFEFMDPSKGDPYGNNPNNVFDDVKNNKHMWVYPTDAGYGNDLTAEQLRNNPLLADSGIKWNGKPATVNDIFRAVHDYFGHIKEGVGFRANGEENAWRAHSAMYSETARMAMTSELRGQNSWVNFGPKSDVNQLANQVETMYADQKAGILPKWVMEEGRMDDAIPTKMGTEGRTGTIKEVPPGALTQTEKEPWQMTRKEFFHPKISQKLFDVASLADNLETIGTVGDFVRGPNTRKLIEPVLDIPVVVLRKIVADGKYVDIPKDMIFGGASGTFKGRQVIFINPDDKQMVKNLFEEIAHSMQYVKGRQGKYSKVDLKQINQNLKFFTGEYLSHPQEVSAKKFADYLSGLKEPTHKDYIQQALAEGKPVPENVLADYPDLTVATTAGPAKPVVSGKILTQTEKEPDLVATANRITEEVRKSVGLDGATKATPEQIADWTEEARKINTSKLMNDMMSGTGNLRPLSKAEELAVGARLSRALERYSSALDELRATDTPSSELLDRIDSARSEIDEISKFSLAVGTEWGKSGVARQALIRADYTTAGVITRIRKQEKLLTKDSSMAIQATKQEMADAEEFARISREKDDKIAALEKKIEDLKAQGAKEAPKRRLELRRQKLESERDDILSQIMGIRSGEKKVPQPKMTGESGAINIADDVALFELYGKLAKNTIQRGALSLEDVYYYVSEVAKRAGHTITKQGMIDALDAQMLKNRRVGAKRATKAELRARQRLYREVERGATRNVAEREREIAAKEAARKAREEAIQIKKDEIAAKREAIRAEREAQKATSKAEADAYRAAAKKAREEARALAKQLREAERKAKLDARQSRRAELTEALGPIARDERKIANLKGRIEDYNRMIETGEFFASRALKEGDEGYELTHLQTQLEQLRYEAKMAKQNVDTIIDDLGQPAWKKVLKEVIELPRYMQLGLDAGALTRQGFDIALVSPTAWTKAAKQGFGAAISNPAKVARLEEEFMRDPEVLKAIANGLAIDGPSAMPEGFVSKAAQKIPLYGRGERFHKTFQNFARYETYRNLTRGQNMNQYQLKETAKLINAMTGRGSWSGAQGKLASIFTAPKMYAGQLEVMGKTATAIVDPRFRTNPAYRKLIVRRWLGRMAGIAALKALADATDWEFSINPDDSDFLKLRNGNTVIDVTGGYSSWYKLLFSTLNDVAESGMSEGFTDKLVRSLGYKVSPTVRTPLSFITGKDAIGKPFFTNPDTGEREMNVQDLAKTFAPLIGMQIYEMAGGDEGYADMDAGAKVALGGLSFIGTGVSNYEAREPSRKPEDTKWGQLLDSIGVQPR